MLRFGFHTAMVLGLTILTQIGGLAWLLALLTRARIASFAALYIIGTVSAMWLAPMAGRVPLPCYGNDSLQTQSFLYCALNRHYVTPELKDVLKKFASDMDEAHPGTQTRVLDGSFPFLTGFPLMPHLSHDDGRKVDLAFYYTGEDGAYLPGKTRSAIGYFAFQDGPSDCPDRKLTLRWDMSWLQSFWPTWGLDEARMTTALELLVRDRRVEMLLIEPHLEELLGVSDPKIRFQGCRAARHDDHIHLQI